MCVIRKVGCHSNCKDYKEYIDELAMVKEIKRKKNICRDYASASKGAYFSDYKVKKKFMKK